MEPLITAGAFGVFALPLLLVIGIGLAPRCIVRRDAALSKWWIIGSGLGFALAGAFALTLIAQPLLAIASAKTIWSVALFNLLLGVAAWAHLLQPECDAAETDAAG